MPSYEITYILTTPIFILAIQKLMKCFLGELKYGKKVEFISFLMYGILMIIFYNYIKIPILLLIFNVLVMFLLTFNYESKFIDKFVCVASIYTFLIVFEGIVVRLTSPLDVYATKRFEYASSIGMVLVRVLTLTFSHMFVKIKKTWKKELSIPFYYYIAQILILIGILYLYLIAITGSTISIAQTILCSVILLLISLITILVDEKVYNTLIIANENSLLKQQNIAYENETEIVSSSLEAIRGLKHDIKNHILILESIYKNKQFEEFEDYIEKILNEIENENKIVNSTNFIVDSITNLKLKELADDRIEISTNVKIPSKLNILAFDLNVLLSNLLDNAITAIKETDGQVKLSLYMHCVKGSLIIIIDNTYNGKITVSEGNFVTTKKIKDNHGIGLKNVKNIVEQYNGDIDINYTDSTFTVEILIPNIV